MLETVACWELLYWQVLEVLVGEQVGLSGGPVWRRLVRETVGA